MLEEALARDFEWVIPAAVVATAVVREGATCATLMRLQQRGALAVSTLAAAALEELMQVLKEYVRDWVIFGYLHFDSEFFIKKVPGKCSNEDFWLKRYVIDEAKCPPFLRPIMGEVRVAGVCKNFVRHIVEPHAPRRLPREPPDFELEQLEQIVQASMADVCEVMQGVLAHVRTVHDFLLFGRSDFAAALFAEFAPGSEDPQASLISSIVAVTKERVRTDRLAMARRWTRVPELNEVKLVYETDEPLDSVLGPRALDAYGAAHVFLWRLRSVEFRLARCWASARTLISLGLPAGLLAQARQLAIIAVRALHGFFVCDILSLAWAKFEAVGESDFDKFVTAHDAFLCEVRRLKPDFNIGVVLDLAERLDNVCSAVLAADQHVLAAVARDAAEELESIRESLDDEMDRLHEACAADPRFAALRQRLVA